jgi:AraC-like DNA-binding protein
MKSSQPSSSESDPLSDVFTILKLRSARCTRLEAGGDWAVTFPSQARMKFVAVLRGDCWITLPDCPPQRLGTGDTFLLTQSPYTMASGPGVTPIHGMDLYGGGQDLARLGGNETAMLGGGFVFDSGNARMMIDALPRFMLIAADKPGAPMLHHTLAMLDLELAQSGMGAMLMAQRLAEILLIQALRAYVSEHGASAAGWIGALCDAQIGQALKLMHNNVAHRWTVAELASAVAMSRSAFALRFKTIVGTAPLEYLRRWRMQLAEDLGHGVPVATMAARLGYSSESAFGNAYKRAFGRSPKTRRFKADGTLPNA